MLGRNKKRNKSLETYEQNSINKLLFNINLSTVIGSYINLKKTNSAFVGQCPICKTKTYNNHFRVNDKLNIFKCYQCGIAGKTVAGFIMMYYNIPYDKALNFIQNNKKWNKNKNKLIYKRLVVNKSATCEYENLPF